MKVKQLGSTNRTHTKHDYTISSVGVLGQKLLHASDWWGGRGWWGDKQLIKQTLSNLLLPLQKAVTNCKQP